jgi:hypothetical protein
VGCTTCSRLVHRLEQLIKQLVLGALEPRDLLGDVATVPRHRVGVPLRVLVIALRQRRLGDRRPQARVIGLVDEVAELLVRDAQVLPKLLEAVRDVGQAALEHRA